MGPLFVGFKILKSVIFFKKMHFWSSAYFGFTCKVSLALPDILKSFFTYWRGILSIGMVPEQKIKKFYDRAHEASPVPLSHWEPH